MSIHSENFQAVLDAARNRGTASLLSGLMRDYIALPDLPSEELQWLAWDLEAIASQIRIELANRDDTPMDTA